MTRSEFLDDNTHEINVMNGAILRNMYRLIFDTKPITGDRKRDLENLMSLLIQESEPTIKTIKEYNNGR